MEFLVLNRMTFLKQVLQSSKPTFNQYDRYRTDEANIVGKNSYSVTTFQS